MKTKICPETCLNLANCLRTALDRVHLTKLSPSITATGTGYYLSRLRPGRFNFWQFFNDIDPN